MQLLDAISADLYDDAPRLVYADWLEEQGDLARAEYIRVQCELEPIRGQYELARAAELHDRERELMSANWEAWRDELPHRSEAQELGLEASFRRGFVDTVSMPVQTFLELGPQLRATHPTLRRLVLFRVNGLGTELAECPALQGWPELELACWYSDEDARAIASSSWLSQLRVLEIWLARQGRGADTKLCKIMGASRAWPQLRELSLLDPEGDKPKRLVTTVDKAAGRALAVKRRGYPEKFPFAPSFWDCYPGRLPDGRAVMAAENHECQPPEVCLLVFDADGKETGERIELPLPPELASGDGFSPHKERVRQFLREAVGFEPAFLRLHSFQFPWDSWGNLQASHGFYDEWDLLGVPDPPGEPWDDYPRGNGGRLSWVIRTGQYCFGQEGWADQRGRVHTT